MNFEKLRIHHVEDWPHTQVLIISSQDYPELGIPAFGEQTKPDYEGSIKLAMPGFNKQLCLKSLCGCCEPWEVGVDRWKYEGKTLKHYTDEGVKDCYGELGRKMNLDFITAIRACCAKQGITTLIFHLFDHDNTGMAQDKNGLHIISHRPTPAEIDFALYKRAFAELQISHPGLDPEDLAKF